MVVVKIQSITPGPYGTLVVENQFDLQGRGISVVLGKRVGSSEEYYQRQANGDSILDSLFGPTFVGGMGKGSYVLGECDKDAIISSPVEFVLKRGERKVLATCTDRDGQTTELFVSCQ